MKRRCIPLFLCMALSMGVIAAGCSSGGDDTEQTVSETTEDGTSASDDEGSTSAEASSAEEDPFVYENDELNFSVEMPELLKDCMYTEESQTTAYDDTINMVKVYYKGESSDQNIFTLEEMSQDVWDNIKAEEGYVGDELGVSSSGRVVVLNQMQSNPYDEGTDDYDKLEDIFAQMDIISQSFTFLNE